MPKDRIRPDLYEEDFLAWTQSQAAALRALAAQGALLPLDLENLAEEVEDMGRSEVRGAVSLVTHILAHLLKLQAAPSHSAAHHWAHEVRVGRNNLSDYWSRSIARQVGQRFDKIWENARAIAVDGLVDDLADIDGRIPQRCPFSLGQVISVDRSEAGGYLSIPPRTRIDATAPG